MAMYPMNRRMRNAAGANTVRRRFPSQTPPTNAPRRRVVLGNGGTGGTTLPQQGPQLPPGSNHQLPGQTPPIIPGQTVPGQTPTAPAGPLPTLNQNQRGMLHDAFNGQGNFGTQAGPTEDAVRRLMRQGLDAGLGNGQVNNFLNPAFYRGVNDPFGGGRLLQDLSPDQLQALARYAGQQQGNGLDEHGGSGEAQAAFFQAFPELQARYEQLANPNGPRVFDPSRQNFVPAQAPAQPTQTATPQTGQQGQQQQGQPAGPIATPWDAAAAGRDPTKHAAYWASQGYAYNPATDVWTGPGGQTQPSAGPVVNDPNGPQTPRPPGDTGAGVPGGQLPLDPRFEAARRGLDANLQNQLAGVSAGQQRLSAEEQLALARMGTNQGIDQQKLLESMAGRGTTNSSIYGDQLGLLATDYGRQRQDLGISVADAMANLGLQAGDANSSYEQGIIEALLGSAQSSANDPYAPTPRPGSNGAQRRRRRRRRRRQHQQGEN